MTAEETVAANIAIAEANIRRINDKPWRLIRNRRLIRQNWVLLGINAALLNDLKRAAS